MVPSIRSLPSSSPKALALAALLTASAACSPADPASVPDVCGPGFATQVVSVQYGPQAGFGQSSMPGVVFGPPRAPLGDGRTAGSLDVVSLGLGGVIALAFGHDVADEPGPDLIVFENAFYAGGDPDSPFAEPGTVSVSDDGETWTAWPCDDTTPPYLGCAGVHPVLSSPDNGVSPFDPEAAGGEAYDLADLGMSPVRYVRIQASSMMASAAGTSGFDLDAVAVLHPVCP